MDIPHVVLASGWLTQNWVSVCARYSVLRLAHSGISDFWPLESMSLGVCVRVRIVPLRPIPLPSELGSKLCLLGGNGKFRDCSDEL